MHFGCRLVLLISLLPIQVFAGECTTPRPATALADVPACAKKTTCIDDKKLQFLKDRRVFPIYAESMDRFERNCQRQAEQALSLILPLTPQLALLTVPAETRLAVNLISKVKAKVQTALQKSQDRIKWAADCAQAMSQNEAWSVDGSLDAAKTTENYKKNGASPASCAGLWDGRFAKVPIANVINSELGDNRLYLALSRNWKDPASVKLSTNKPTIQGAFFSGTPAQLAPLSEFEKSKIVETRDRLLQECVEANKDECLSSQALQAYAKKRYVQSLNENPILLQFDRAVDPAKPLTGHEIAAAYQKQAEKATRLANVQLSDQDYLKFNYFLDESIAEFPPDQQGDVCEVGGAMLDNEKSKTNAENTLLVAGALYGGVEAGLAKGIAGRIAAFSTGTSYFTDAYMIDQMSSHYSVMKKLESTCAQSHLHAPDLCNVESIRGNSDSLVTDGASTAFSGVLTAFGLYGPLRTLMAGASK